MNSIMVEATKARTAQIHTAQGWVDVGLSQIEPGNRFRVLRADGTTVAGRCGSEEFTATQHPRAQSCEALQKRVYQRFSSLFAHPPDLA